MGEGGWGRGEVVPGLKVAGWRVEPKMAQVRLFGNLVIWVWLRIFFSTENF